MKDYQCYFMQFKIYLLKKTVWNINFKIMIDKQREIYCTGDIMKKVPSESPLNEFTLQEPFFYEISSIIM